MSLMTRQLFEEFMWFDPSKLQQVEWLLQGEPCSTDAAVRKAYALMDLAAWVDCIGWTSRSGRLWQQGMALLPDCDPAVDGIYFDNLLMAVVSGIVLRQNVARQIERLSRACNEIVPLSQRLVQRSTFGATIGYMSNVLPTASGLSSAILNVALAEASQLEHANVRVDDLEAEEVFLSDQPGEPVGEDASPLEVDEGDWLRLKRQARRDEKISGVDEALYLICLGSLQSSQVGMTLWGRADLHSIASQATRGPSALAAYAYFALRVGDAKRAADALARAERFVAEASSGNVPRDSGREQLGADIDRALPLMAQTSFGLTHDQAAASSLMELGCEAIVRNCATSFVLTRAMERLLVSAGYCQVGIKPHQLVVPLVHSQQLSQLRRLTLAPASSDPVPPHLILPTLGGLFISYVPSWVGAHVILDGCSDCGGPRPEIDGETGLMQDADLAAAKAAVQSAHDLL